MSIVKLILAGLIIWGLGESRAGNWIKCRFLDTTGCLAKIELEVAQEEIIDFGFLSADNDFKRIDIPTDFSGYTCFRYTIELKNHGSERPESVSLGVVPLATANQFNARILGYETLTGPVTRKDIYQTNTNKFTLSPDHFENGTSFIWVWEHAKINVFICYPKQTFSNWSGKVLLIEAECEHCQKPYITYLVDEARKRR